MLFCYFSWTVPLENFRFYKTGRKYVELFLGKSRRFFYSFGEDVIFFSNLVATTRISKHLHKLSLFDNDRQGKKKFLFFLANHRQTRPWKGGALSWWTWISTRANCCVGWMPSDLNHQNCPIWAGVWNDSVDKIYSFANSVKREKVYQPLPRGRDKSPPPPHPWEVRFIGFARVWSSRV